MPWNTNNQVATPLTGSDRVNGSGGALCLTALRGAYRRVSQSRICTAVLAPVQSIAWGVRPLRDSSWVTNHPAFSNIIVARNVYQVKQSRSVTKQLQQFLFVAASLQFVEERIATVPAPTTRSTIARVNLDQSWKAGPRTARNNHKRNRDVASLVRSPYGDQ